MNYTPGPWGYTGRSKTGHLDSIFIYSKNPECKRNVCIGEVYFDDAEPQSLDFNAYLIAAAPELETKLREALRIITTRTPQYEINTFLKGAAELLRRIDGGEAS